MSEKENKNIQEEEIQNQRDSKPSDKEQVANEVPKEKQKNTAKEQESDKQEALLKVEKDKYLRLFAEFENYKKRTAKERIELFQTAGKDVIQDLLPVLDDFDRALLELQKNESDKELSKGIALIFDKFKKILHTKGLKEMAVEKGTIFDSDLHEAITQIPAPDEDLKGKVIDVVEKGYKIADKIIRYPKVVIGQK